MTTSKQQKIDEFIATLTKYIDIRYTINKEFDLGNQYYIVKELNPQYKTITRQLEDSLEELLDNKTEA